MKIDVNGFRMAYHQSGTGRPLLLVHGYPLSSRLWQPQLEELATEARVLAPDLRGHGDSQVTPGPYSMDLFADDLSAFLDALGTNEPVVLCGLSMGGYVALTFVRKYASRLAGLILTATRAGPDSPEARVGRDQAANLARQKGPEAVYQSMLPRLLAPQNYASRPDLVEKALDIMSRTSLEGILGDLAALKERPDSTPALAQIRIPALILHGEHDNLIPMAEAQVMHATIPGARLEIIPEAGHLPNLENPHAFNLKIRQFLASLP